VRTNGVYRSAIRKKRKKMGKGDKEACVEEREMTDSKNCHV
jgi:hypothetical protein